MNSSTRPPESVPTTLPSPPESSRARRFVRIVFFGRRGLRAGWRLLIFICVYGVIRYGELPLSNAALQWLATPAGTVTPWFLLVVDAGLLVRLLLATWIMGKIEKRRFAHYGMPWRRAFHREFWEGSLWGFAALGVVVGGLVATHSISLSSGMLSPVGAIEQGFFWGTAFVVVGFTEEFLFRGYGLATLAEGIGFWPAAVVFSLAFGAGHMANVGENYLGVLSVIASGLVFCLALRRTGNLWFAIGLHAAWSWSETYFYGVSDSGFVSSSHLLSSNSHGPAWLSGGSVGPEGSVMALAMLVILWLAISWRFQHVRFPTRTSEPTPPRST